VPVVENYCSHLEELNVPLTKLTFQLKNSHFDNERLEKFGGEIEILERRLSISWFSKLIKLCRGHSVLLCHGFNGTILAVLVKIFVPIRVISTYHGEYHPNGRLAGLKRLVIRALYLFSLKYVVDDIVTVESYSKFQLIQKGVSGRKIKIIYNAIDVRRTKFKASNKVKDLLDIIPNFDRVILSVCRLDKVKGLRYALSALANLDENVSWLYLIAGNGPEEKTLKRFANKLGVEDRVVFLGYIPNPEPLYDISDIFLLPSEFEYHSISILEAMRAGKTIISTSVGGTPESVKSGKEGILVQHSSVEELLNALNQVCLDKDFAERLALNARNKFAKAFTLELQRDKISELIFK